MELYAMMLGLLELSSVVSAAVERTSSPPVVSIGAIFDESARKVPEAFQHEVSSFAPKSHFQAGVKLHQMALRAQVDDSYSLGTTMCQLMNRGVFALFGSHTASTINTVKSFSATFRMPYVTTSFAANTTSPDLRYELYMRPLYAQAIVELIRRYTWPDLWYIYNTNEGLERLQQLLEALAGPSGYSVRTKVFRVTDAEDAFEMIQLLDGRPTDERRIVLDMSTRESEEVLLKAGINEITIPAFTRGGMNVTGLALVDFRNNTVTSYLKNWSVQKPDQLKNVGGANVIPYESALTIDAIRAVNYALSKMAAQNPAIFRLTSRDGRESLNGSELLDCDADPVKPWRHGYEVMKFLREIELNHLTGVVKFDKFGLRRDYKLDVLECSLSRALVRIGSWYSEAGLKLETVPSIVRPVKGEAPIANKTRIITSIVTQPYLTLRDPSTSDRPLIGNDQYEGYCADLARKIAEKVQFDFEIRPVKDSKYGALDDNGTWNGMVGELMRREADLVIAPLTITAAREKVVDFSKPFMSLGISIMIKKPVKETPGVVSFMKPLSYEIWMCVIFAYIGVSVVLFLVSRFSPFEWHIEDNTDGPTVTNNFTIFNSLWFSLGAFMQQGCDIEPRSMSGRIVGSVWWFFTLIIISSYTANLAAFLTVERMQSPIESADDLAKQTEIKYGTVGSGSTQDFFKKSGIPVYERMWSFMSSAEPSVFVKSNEEGVAMVRGKNGKYAFLAESTSIDYMNQRLPCDTMKVGSNLDSKGYGVGTPLGSDLRDRITLAVLELLEGGELTKLETKWWLENGQCGGAQGTPKKQDSTSSLKLSNVAGIFYILMAGLVLALITAVVEFLYKSKLDAGKRKTSFGNALRSKAKLSVTGKPESLTTGYTYCPAAQLISVDGYADYASRTHV